MSNTYPTLSSKDLHEKNSVSSFKNAIERMSGQTFAVIWMKPGVIL